jgi:uncharacterized membrane protein
VNPLLLAHVTAGGLGLVSGFIALHAGKGAPLHRRAGMFFVAVMLAMAATGIVLAILEGEWAVINVSAGLTTTYLVVTALSAVRPPSATTRRIERAALLVGGAVGITMLVFGSQAVAAGGNRDGIPAFPFLLFGTIGTLGAIGDLRRLRAAAPPRGPVRLGRHLWRMSLALFIAAMSFFFGQADVFPKALRIMPLLAVPPFSVLGVMLYWLWRVRGRRALQGLTLVARPGGGGAMHGGG